MSTMRHCEVYKADNDKWYLELGNQEYAGPEDSTTYGPFKSEEAAEEYIGNFSNPGGWCTDSSGTQPAPTKSPDGSPIEKPRRFQWSGLIYR